MTTRGEVLEYLGMTIDDREKGKVHFSMKEYINKILEEWHAHYNTGFNKTG